MLYKAHNELVEARSDDEAAEILGTRDFRRYDKPSQKAFLMWVWLRADRKDGRMLKYMLGQPCPYLEEYRADPNIVRRELKRSGIKLSEWAMIGEPEYDQEKHSEFFYRREDLA